MKNKIQYMLRFLLLATVFFFQSSPLIGHLSVGGVNADWLLTILFIFTFYLGDTELMVYAVVFGSMTDLLFGKIYGIITLLMLAILFICKILNRYINTERKTVVCTYLALVTLIYQACMLLISFAIWSEVITFGAAFRIILIKCVYNAVIAIPVFYIVKKLHELKQEVRI